MTNAVLDRPLLSVRSVAAKLAVSDKTVWRLIRAGEEPFGDPCEPGTTHVFRKGEAAEADHPAVLEVPGLFREPRESDVPAW